MIRRAAGHASSELSCGPLRLDTKASKADVDGVPLKLTSHEFRLLAYLMHHMGEVVSRTELVEHLYDQDFDRDSNTIEVFVGRLRKKMGIDMIETVRGMGYRMREPERDVGAGDERRSRPWPRAPRDPPSAFAGLPRHRLFDGLGDSDAGRHRPR